LAGLASLRVICSSGQDGRFAGRPVFSGRQGGVQVWHSADVFCMQVVWREAAHCVFGADGSRREVLGCQPSSGLFIHHGNTSAPFVVVDKVNRIGDLLIQDSQARQSMGWCALLPHHPAPRKPPCFCGPGIAVRGVAGRIASSLSRYQTKISKSSRLDPTTTLLLVESALQAWTGPIVVPFDLATRLRSRSFEDPGDAGRRVVRCRVAARCRS
jgi:hypothetical protein